MLMNLFVFWILASMFFGTRQARRAFSVIFGIFAFVWIAKLLLIFGVSLLPLILLVLVVSKVVVPFVVTFLHHFQ